MIVSKNTAPPTKRGPGRPPRADKASTERIELRVTTAERKDWEARAALGDQPLSEWIRVRCNQ